MNWLNEALERTPQETKDERPETPHEKGRLSFATRPLLGDGGMGTMLIDAGLPLGTSPELWNVERPGIVEGIQRQYVEAGAQFVTANTFGASPLALARHGLVDRCAELNAAAVELARKAGAERVLGDLGPSGRFLEPYGDLTVAELRHSYKEQVRALREAGADGIIVETMSDPVELSFAVRVARDISDWPVLATFAFQKAGDRFRTMMGATVVEAFKAAIDAGADAAGANCGTGLSFDDYRELAAELVEASNGFPVILQPNAGAPREADGSFVYDATPAEFAAWGVDAAAQGVKIVGGCCGTTPAHIRALAEALRG